MFKKKYSIVFNRRYQALQDAESSKSKEHSRMVKVMEAAHVSAAEQLEKLYEKKVGIENSKLFLNANRDW